MFQSRTSVFLRCPSPLTGTLRLFIKALVTNYHRIICIGPPDNCDGTVQGPVTLQHKLVGAIKGMEMEVLSWAPSEEITPLTSYLSFLPHLTMNAPVLLERERKHSG